MNNEQAILNKLDDLAKGQAELRKQINIASQVGYESREQRLIEMIIHLLALEHHSKIMKLPRHLLEQMIEKFLNPTIPTLAVYQWINTQGYKVDDNAVYRLFDNVRTIYYRIELNPAQGQCKVHINDPSRLIDVISAVQRISKNQLLKLPTDLLLKLAAQVEPLVDGNIKTAPLRKWFESETKIKINPGSFCSLVKQLAKAIQTNARRQSKSESKGTT